jgi:hypothetical protein
MTHNSRFPRASRDDPSRSGECTDIPGFYGVPVGTLHAPKRVPSYRIGRYIAVLLIVTFVVKLFT